MAMVHVGIDLAKNVFALHGVSETGAVHLRQPKVARAKLVEVVAALPPCTIGMEACTGAHHWARQFAQHGHTVKLMAPKLVAPYRMSGARWPRTTRPTPRRSAKPCSAPTCALFPSRPKSSSPA